MKTFNSVNAFLTIIHLFLLGSKEAFSCQKRNDHQHHHHQQQQHHHPQHHHQHHHQHLSIHTTQSPASSEKVRLTYSSPCSLENVYQKEPNCLYVSEDCFRAMEKNPEDVMNTIRKKSSTKAVWIPSFKVEDYGQIVSLYNSSHHIQSPSNVSHRCMLLSGDKFTSSDCISKIPALCILRGNDTCKCPYELQELLNINEVLQLYKSDKELKLFVSYSYSPSHIFCYAVGFQDVLLYNNYTQKKIVGDSFQYSFKPPTNNYNIYKCTLVFLNLYSYVTSNEILFGTSNITEEYAMEVQLFKYCTSKFVDCYNNKFLINLQNSLNINNNITDYNIRIMKVLDVSFNNTNDVVLLIHVSSSILDEAPTKEFILDLFRRVLPEVTVGISSIKPTFRCDPDETSIGSGSLHWEYADTGSTVLSVELCIQPNGLPVTRRCEGNFLFGAEWSRPSGICNVTDSHVSKGLLQLSMLDAENRTAEEVSQILASVTTSTGSSNIKAVDISMIANIFRGLSSRCSGDNDKVLNNALQVLNVLFEVPRVELEISGRAANSTDVLLENFDRILEDLTPKELNETGFFRVVTKNLIYQVSDVTANRVRGIALYRPALQTRSTIPFTGFTIRNITTALLESLELDNLDVAVVIPDKLFNEIKSRGSNPRIHITIFYNDTLFIESEDRAHEKIGTKIISVTIPGFRSTLPSPIQLIFNNDHQNKFNDTCVYWKFGDEFQNSTSAWSSEDFSKEHSGFTKKHIVMCEADHLTHFALLLPNLLNYKIEGIQEEILDLITAVNLTLSFIGIIIIFVTAIRFRSWREKESTKILLHVATSIILQTILLYLSDQRNIYKSDVYCILSGCLLHYFILVGFSWMLIISFCQYQRYIRVFGGTPSNFVLYSSLVSWGTPIILIVISLSVNYENYIPNNVVISTLCYPSGYVYYTLLLLPISIILLINLCVFIWITVTICRIKSIVKNNCKCHAHRFVISIKISVLLFFLLGLVWLFGILSAVSSSTLFTYLFTVTATLQGFVLFLFCVVMDKKTRYLWLGLFKKYRFYSVTSTATEVSTSGLKNN